MYCKHRYFRAVKFSHPYPSEEFTKIINNTLSFYIILIFMHTYFFAFKALRKICTTQKCLISELYLSLAGQYGIRL